MRKLFDEVCGRVAGAGNETTASLQYHSLLFKCRYLTLGRRGFVVVVVANVFQ
jgi:hypothetical protein